MEEVVTNVIQSTFRQLLRNEEISNFISKVEGSLLVTLTSTAVITVNVNAHSESVLLKCDVDGSINPAAIRSSAKLYTDCFNDETDDSPRATELYDVKLEPNDGTAADATNETNHLDALESELQDDINSEEDEDLDRKPCDEEESHQPSISTAMTLPNRRLNSRQSRKHSKVWQHYLQLDHMTWQCRFCSGELLVRATQGVKDLWKHFDDCVALPADCAAITAAQQNESVAPPKSIRKSAVCRDYGKLFDHFLCINCQKTIVTKINCNMSYLWRHLSSEHQQELQFMELPAELQSLQTLRQSRKRAKNVPGHSLESPAGKRLTRRKRSSVWNHFEDSGEIYSECLYCQQTLKIVLNSAAEDSETTQGSNYMWLWEHLRMCPVVQQSTESVQWSVERLADVLRKDQRPKNNCPLWQHVSKPYRLITCKGCSITLQYWTLNSSSTGMLRHLDRCSYYVTTKEQPSRYMCELCHYGSTNENTLRSHMTKKHGCSPASSTTAAISPVAGDSECPVNEADLPEEIRQEDNEAPEDGETNKPGKRNPVWKYFIPGTQQTSKCHYCQTMLKSSNSNELNKHSWLWDHLRECGSLTGEQRNAFIVLQATEEATKLPYQEGLLWKHVHRPTTKAWCNFCGYSLDIKANISPTRLMWRHLYTCLKATEDVKTEVLLNIQRQRSPKVFMCDKCSFETVHNCSLKLHIKRKHPRL